MLKLTTTILLILLQLFCKSQDTFNLDKRPIYFTSPYPFEEGMRESEDVKYYALTFSTGNNEILACYIPTKELLKAKKEESFSMTEMIKIFTPKSMVSKSAQEINIPDLNNGLLRRLTESSDDTQAKKAQKVLKKNF